MGRAARSVRDTGRAAVYQAELQVRAALERAAGGRLDFFGSQLQLPVERRFSNLDEVRTYLHECQRDPRVVAGYGDHPQVGVRPRAGDQQAHYSAGVIAIPVASDWAMREMVVLHELAHHLAWSDSAPSHGPAFRSAYLELVEWFIGAEVALILRTALQGTGAVA